MGKIILFSFLFMQQGNATEPKYIFKTWCKGLKNNEVFKYVKEASDFVGIDPLHLTVGMSGEGFSEKHDYPKNVAFGQSSTMTRHLSLRPVMITTSSTHLLLNRTKLEP